MVIRKNRKPVKPSPDGADENPWAAGTSRCGSLLVCKGILAPGEITSVAFHLGTPQFLLPL